MLKKWKRLDTKTVYTSKWLNLYSDTYLLPSGVQQDEYMRVKRDNYVVIFAHNEKNEVIIERQYRRGVNEINIELPAGNIDKEENPLDTAVRELLDETGYKCEPYASHEMYPDPAYIEQRAFIVYCHLQEKQKETNREFDEFIEYELVTIDDIVSQIKSGEIKDKSMIAAVGFFLMIKDDHKFKN